MIGPCLGQSTVSVLPLMCLFIGSALPCRCQAVLSKGNLCHYLLTVKLSQFHNFHLPQFILI
uniref:Uncharacterized protein n=1 Tax=Anguilla anguilla TaxID=7936 RepID=A0A0E9SJT9_ANGAN